MLRGGRRRSGNPPVSNFPGTCQDRLCTEGSQTRRGRHQLIPLARTAGPRRKWPLCPLARLPVKIFAKEVQKLDSELTTHPRSCAQSCSEQRKVLSEEAGLQTPTGSEPPIARSGGAEEEMWSLPKGGPERPMASGAWALLSPPATGHRSCPGAFTVLTIFLFLPRFPASGCPGVCSCSLGKVNCVDRRLRFVPLQLPTNATTLLLDYNRIAILRNGTFAAQKVLRRLSLGSNLLASIHRLALVGLRELQDLDLSDNSLSLLHPETFLPVPTLRTLNLGNNRLLRLEPELPGALPHLRALFVHSNALTSLPTGFFESLPSLSYLTLEGNPWTCSCGIRPLFLWLVKNREKVPETNAVTCKRRASLAQYPISALGNESFARCQAPRMHLSSYAFFLLIGPSTFLASICVGILLGSLAVARLKLRTGSCIWPRALVKRAGTPLR